MHRTHLSPWFPLPAAGSQRLRRSFCNSGLDGVTGRPDKGQRLILRELGEISLQQITVALKLQKGSEAAKT